MYKILSIGMFLCLTEIVMAQISGPWPNSCYEDPFTDYSMRLNGKVKSWSFSKSNGETRTMTFDKERLTDTYKGTTQTFVPPDFMVYKLKLELEKSYSAEERKSDHVYNKFGQIIEVKSGRFHEKRVFDENGKVLMRHSTISYEETRAWNSIHHAEPTYTYTVTNKNLVFFKYNHHGSLKEISYFDSDPNKNLKMVYIYDDKNNMVETNRYDSYNISVSDMPDNYLNSILSSDLDTNFSIHSIYPNYWKIGQPAMNKWKYDDAGRKIEYNAYGYKPNGGAAIISFIANWEYDENGNLKKEIHHDVWRNRIREIFEFDSHQNAIKVTEFGSNGTEDVVTEVKIVYY